jgi:hypothetical protein
VDSDRKPAAHSLASLVVYLDGSILIVTTAWEMISMKTGISHRAHREHRVDIRPSAAVTPPVGFLGEPCDLCGFGGLFRNRAPSLHPGAPLSYQVQTISVRFRTFLPLLGRFFDTSFGKNRDIRPKTGVNKDAMSADSRRKPLLKNGLRINWHAEAVE